MKLTITQRAQNGILSGPKCVSFSVKVNNASFDIGIQQCGVRIITIDTEDGSYQGMLYVYDVLETLLMLMDGQFYPVISVSDGTDITASWNKRRLPSYSSAEFMIGSVGILLDFDKVLDEKIICKWSELKEKLDLVHKMVLYCLSDVEMPKDMQSAYMIEAFKGLCDLVHDEDNTFAESLYKHNNGKELPLKNAFLAVVDKYGAVIFAEEKEKGLDGFARVLIESRNRIAHIKPKKGKRILNGEENVWYIVKLSLLYRIVLFDLLGIPQNEYDQQLKSYIDIVNKREAVKKFLKGLTKNGPAPVDKKLESDIYNLLYTFVYSMAIYRSIYARSGKTYHLDICHEHFWHAISENCLQLAVVNWCKVFGAADERTHYSKIYTDFIEVFEKTVAEKGIDFAEYSKSMKHFRDTYISHRDKQERQKQIPYLDSALTICDLYERIVLCGEPNRELFDLAGHYNQYAAEISQYLDSLGIQKI